MSDQAPIEEAAQVSILLEQEIQKKMALAVADFLFSDNDFLSSGLITYILAGEMRAASMEVRRQLGYELARDHHFQSALRSMFVGALHENRATIEAIVRDTIERDKMGHPTQGTFNSSHSGPYVKLKP